MKSSIVSLTGLLMLAGVWPALAAPLEGIGFSHHDWEIACDNTRTCRAAGYQDDSGEGQPVSVLLTRKAGPGEPVLAQLRIGDLDGEDSVVDAVLAMRVNGKPLGQVELEGADGIARLAPAQTQALLAALTRTSKIEWSSGKRRWRLSDKGSAAVLLKMDEFQGRLGTPGALVKKGGKDERSVLPAVPAPVIDAAAVPANDRVALSSTSPKGLQAALHAVIDQDCADTLAPTRPKEELAVVRLSNTKLLASTTCWTAAYNQGIAYWLVNASAPYRPELVTGDGSDYDKGTITAAQKGRGIGDCWSFDEWTWDGRGFVHSSEGTTGMCKQIAGGGAWSLPVLVTTVRPARSSP